MTRRTIRFALGLLATGAVCGTALFDDVNAQSAGGVRVVRVKKEAKAGLKIGLSYTVVTKQGKVFSGKLTKQDAKSITLKLKGGGTAKVLRKDIETIGQVAASSSDAQKRLEALKRQREALRQQLEARRLALQLRQRSGARNQSADRDDADPRDPHEKVVLLSPKGPVIVEIAIYVDGKPFRMLREAIVDDLMGLAKSKENKDGKLTWEKALAEVRFSFGRYAYVARNAGSRTALVRRYDLNGDGLVQRAEVRRFISQLGYGSAFNVRPNYTALKQPDVNSVLDTDKDGVISAEELKAAPERLKSRDADDNDLLTAAELGGGPARRGGLVQLGRGGGMRLPTTPRIVFQLGPSASLTSLYSQLSKHYGDEKKVVRAAAFRIDPALFRTLDLNKNGVLESGEVIAFHLAKPAVKLEIRIGKDDKHAAGAVVKSLARGLQVDGTEGKPSEHLSVSLPGWKLRIHAVAGSVRTYDYTRTAESYVARFDTNKNGYIEEKELKTLGAAAQYQLQQFKLWDANGDGKVYADEIKKAFERALAPQMSQVSLTEQSQGPSLFAALDETGDGRLSLREMRNAGKRLLKLDRNKNGRIDPDEMPSEVSLSFSRGYGGYGYGQQAYNPRGRKSAPVRGPRWFYHMDKNGDGDVTLREFLGTKAQFKKLDTNRDGFIELKEAEAVAKTAKR